MSEREVLDKMWREIDAIKKSGVQTPLRFDPTLDPSGLLQRELDEDLAALAREAAEMLAAMGDTDA